MLNHNQFPLTLDAILHYVSPEPSHFDYFGELRLSTLSELSFHYIIKWIDVSAEYALDFKILQVIHDLSAIKSRIYKRLECEYALYDSEGYVCEYKPCPDAYSDLINAYIHEIERLETLKREVYRSNGDSVKGILTWNRPIPLIKINYIITTPDDGIETPIQGKHTNVIYPS